MRPVNTEGGASSSTGGHAAGPPEGEPPGEGARGRRSRTPARDIPAVRMEDTRREPQGGVERRGAMTAMDMT
eukprot:5930732-Lingulodinium_polyedra.AAC.1